MSWRWWVSVAGRRKKGGRMKTRLCRLFTLTMALAATTLLADTAKPVKYVFLFIGDGMSIPQRMMTDEYLARKENGKLLIDTFPHQAITTTRAADQFITDSAASGTAIACGEKTNNGRIGMDAAGERKLESVAYVAKKSGRKVGIVTTVTLNHATPAAFYAHNPSRGNYYQIGLDLIASGFDYFGGGGLAKHDDREHKDYKGDVYKLAEEAGYTVSLTKEGFGKLKPGGGKVISLGAKADLPYAIDQREGDLNLADFTRQGIELLDNDKGFFMMVEGGKIDWMCHANDAATTIKEVIDFDNAVKVAYDFAQKHPRDTLIVVTGDHETGGLTLGFGGTGYRSYIQNLSAQTCSRNEMQSRFKAAKATEFAGIKPEITATTGLLFTGGEKAELGTLNLSDSEIRTLEDVFAQHLKKGVFKGHSPLATAAIKLLNNKSGVAWTSGAHTALPVSTTAFGAQAGLFASMLDNTDIAKRLKLLVVPM